MLLKSLELQGFKSFPEKTVLTFNSGITAVVGPNGSGKSNISDAIRWVLGEQAIKSIRCSKMEDIIFNGTTERKAKGFASVTLTISNEDRKLPVDDDDLFALQCCRCAAGSQQFVASAVDDLLQSLFKFTNT